MFELEIVSPKPSQRFPEIKWNNEALKEQITAAVQVYRGLVVTAEDEKEARDTRARLNKLYNSLEDARKDMKKRVTEPLTKFEAEVREVEAPIKDAINAIDVQLQELEEQRQKEKAEKIKEIFAEVFVGTDFVDIGMIYDSKWMNKTCALKQVKADMEQTAQRIKGEVETLTQLPEFAFEAVEFYKKSLSLQGALQKQAELVEIRRKKEAEAEKTMPATPQNGLQEEEKKPVTESTSAEPPVESTERPQFATNGDQARIYTFVFRIAVTGAQAKALGDYCRSQGIKLERIQ